MGSLRDAAFFRGAAPLNSVYREVDPIVPYNRARRPKSISIVKKLAIMHQPIAQSTNVIGETLFI